ncbi:Kelch repeat-containing protein [Emticicia agri]|uniref:Galactose oxidase n=1 Tax=Emticicia agri TaxID=2492393 RepID=A0A4Q5LWP9_9BACT|nr:kelch repeat-containing protein [Emticicia agri]RYU94236.1 hypothetical protein EWM59_18230 [Emticicia agri]
MRKILLIALIIFPLMGIGDLFAQTGIIQTNGVYVPRLSTANRNAIASPTDGQMIYNTDDDCFNFYRAGTWQKLCGYDIPYSIDYWTKKTDLGGSTRQSAVGFTIGSKGYIGTGYDAGTYKADLWEYNPDTNSWTQKATLPGGGRYAAVGFAMSGKGYVGTGYNNVDGYKADFWEYNPTNNTWTQKADFIGTPRQSAVGFAIGSKGYIGTGNNGAGTARSDFFEYDPTANGWTQKADFGGGVRYGAFAFAIDTKGYIGTGFNNTIYTNDFWEYDATANTWTQKANFSGSAREYAVGFPMGTKGYVGTGYDGAAKNDFFEYDPVANTWASKPAFTGSARRFAVGFAIGSKAYIGTGSDGAPKKDFYEYNPTPTPYTTMTQQGNDFNGPNQLVKLDGSGSIPANLSITGNLNIGGQLQNIESFTAASLINSWVNYDAPTYAAAAFYKDKKSLVYLKGIIKDGTTTSSTVLFNLPVGYRPAEISVFAVLNGASYGRVDIFPNGDVKIISGGNTFLSLDGISFKAN